MPRSKLKHNHFNTNPHCDLVKLWSLRVFILLEGWRKSDFSRDYINNDLVLQAIGLEHLEGEEIGKLEFRRILKQKLHEVEGKKDVQSPKIFKNLEILKEEIKLSNTEIKLLTFALILKTNTRLEVVCDFLGELTSEATIAVLEVILNIPVDKIRFALSRQSTLYRSGILRLDRRYADELNSKIDLIEGFGVLLEPHSDAEELMKNFFHPTGEGTLVLDDYNHIKDELQLATKYLTQVIRNSIPGVNILLYGPPGTGKTELAKAISNQLTAKLYEVAINNVEYESLSEKERLEAYRLAQMVLARRKNTLLLFDEVESQLERELNSFFMFGGRNEKPPTKACTNNLLENNKVPAIWIANNIDNVDKAFIRRFDYVLHLDYPPQKVRAKIIKKHLASLPVSEKWMEGVAENKNISPAIIANASKVVASLKYSEQAQVEPDLELILGNSLTAMGHDKMVKKRKGDALPYCLKAINPDSDLTLLLKGLKKRPEARLCLYGPPGTGKTEFGHYLAQTLDKRLLVRRASDILNAYVGGTEANIAMMFMDAKKENAVLLLDEADSFLHDRNHAYRSWEVTQVNELLTQMDTYDGIFICSTNLMDNLDAASLRRFDLKIKFDYLKANQAWLLFKQLFQNQIIIAEKGKWESKLAKLKTLTPGDFANAIRQNHISGSPLSPQVLIDCLTRESSFKTKSHDKSYGFVTN